MVISNPPNQKSANGDFSIVWDANFAANINNGIEKAQEFIDNECIKLMKPYTPMNTGALMESVTLGTVIGSGRLVYQSPYARYQYYGEVYGPSIPIFEAGNPAPIGFFSPRGQKKYATGRQLEYNTHKHAKAGKMWFERMKADYAADIAKGAAKLMGGVAK